MIIVWSLSWWYSAGWKAHGLKVLARMTNTLDYFSIDLLIKTLFSPFRQISAGNVSGPIGVRWRAFVDKLISRIIGAIVRSIMIVVGSVWLLIQGISGIISLVLWLIIPFLPIIGVIVAVSGWVPRWM